MDNQRPHGREGVCGSAQIPPGSVYRGEVTREKHAHTPLKTDAKGTYRGKSEKGDRGGVKVGLLEKKKKEGLGRKR